MRINTKTIVFILIIYLEIVRSNIVELLLYYNFEFNQTYLIYSSLNKHKKEIKKYDKIKRKLFYVNKF